MLTSSCGRSYCWQLPYSATLWWFILGALGIQSFFISYRLFSELVMAYCLFTHLVISNSDFLHINFSLVHPRFHILIFPSLTHIHMYISLVINEYVWIGTFQFHYTYISPIQEKYVYCRQHTLFHLSVVQFLCTEHNSKICLQWIIPF